MPEYRVFPIDARNHVIGPGAVITSDDDDRAIEEAQLLADGHDVEVWQETRLIAVVTKDGAQKS